MSYFRLENNVDGWRARFEPVQLIQAWSAFLQLDGGLTSDQDLNRFKSEFCATGPTSLHSLLVFSYSVFSWHSYKVFYVAQTVVCRNLHASSWCSSVSCNSCSKPLYMITYSWFVGLLRNDISKLGCKTYYIKINSMTKLCLTWCCCFTFVSHNYTTLT